MSSAGGEYSGRSARPDSAASMGSDHKDGFLLDAALRVPAAVPDSLSTEAILGPKRPRVKKIWHTRYLKLLVVGDSGLGKTTLVRSLLAVPGEDVDLHDGSETSFVEFQKNPEAFLSSVSWTDDDDSVRWVYQVQDTPGYGDSLDINQNVARIKGYIRAQNLKWMKLETDRNRADLTDVLDPRVDLCIFCLPPHRLRNIDLLFMHEISQDVPVLPVVMKADTMTVLEANKYRADVRRRLDHPVQLPGAQGPVNIFSFDADTMAAVGVPPDSVASTVRPPYLVVCSNEYSRERMAQDVPELWPQRQYLWGVSEAFNPLHSDLLLLRRLLLQEGTEEISRDKKLRYERWRTREMTASPLQTIMKYAVRASVTVIVLLGAAHASGRVNLREAFKGAMEPVTKPPITVSAAKALKHLAESVVSASETDQAEPRKPSKESLPKARSHW